MALSILNNIPSMAAQNQLSLTNASLQTTLFRLSSGSRINSGADDAAGLAIADGLRANVTALSQSQRNATDGVGKLQVADGALAQVTNLLNRAVTLATESGTGTVSDIQRVALNNEFSKIKSEIDRIGSQTTFNGVQLFNSGSATDKNTLVSATGGFQPTDTLGTNGNDGTMVLTDADTGKSQSIAMTGGTTTVQDVLDAINNSTNINATASLDSGGHIVITDKNSNGSLMVASETSNVTTALGAVSNPTLTNPNEFVSAGTFKTTALTTGHHVTITDTDTGTQFDFPTDGTLTGNDLIAQINASTAIHATASISGGKLVITDNNGNGSLAIDSDLAVGDGGAIARAPQSGSASTDIFLSDASGTGSGTISVSIGALSQSQIGFTNSINLSSNDLLSQGNAQTALTQINLAISNVAADRGTLGASINRLTAASNVISNQIQNLSAAEDGIRSADIAQEVANMTKFTILNQTGISALAQANQMQQSVLKLLQ